jgi:hypothetical protein
MAQDLAYLLSERARLLADIANINAQLAYARSNGNPAIVAGLEQRLASDNELLAVVNEGIQSTQNSLPVEGAGAIVASDKTATTQNPAPPADVLTAPGRISPDNVETGTDATIRPLTQTQATPQPPVVPFATKDQEGNVLPPTASLNAGVGARTDDGTVPNTNTTQQAINTKFTQQIVSQPNVLDQYASYTYAISWYLLGPNNFNEMQKNFKKNISQWQLLMQSGGAPTGASNGSTAGRNQFFDLDYYMDNLEIESQIIGRGTLSGTNTMKIHFTVTEPNGMTLLTKLSAATKTLAKQSPPKNPNTGKLVDPNYMSFQHCLCIRFYGYDAQGNLSLPLKGQYSPSGTPQPTDPQAIIEKWFPFTIGALDFKLANKVVEYQITGIPLQYFTNKSQDRGTIPFAFELLGETVSDVMIGKAVGTQYPPQDDGRATAPTPSNTGPQQAPTKPSTVRITSVDEIQYDALGNPIGSY